MKQDAITSAAAEESTPPVTLDDVKKQAARIVNEIHTLKDYAREVDERDELPFDIDLVDDLLNEAEALSNIADGIE